MQDMRADDHELRSQWLEARSGCPGHQARSEGFRTVYVSTEQMAGVIQREHADLTAQTVGQPNSLTIPIAKEPEVSLENEKHIRKAYQAAEEKDIEAFIGCFTDDGTFTDQSIGVTSVSYTHLTLPTIYSV